MGGCVLVLGGQQGLCWGCGCCITDIIVEGGEDGSALGSTNSAYERLGGGINEGLVSGDTFGAWFGFDEGIVVGEELSIDEGAVVRCETVAVVQLDAGMVVLGLAVYLVCV